MFIVCVLGEISVFNVYEIWVFVCVENESLVMFIFINKNYLEFFFIYLLLNNCLINININVFLRKNMCSCGFIFWLGLLKCFVLMDCWVMLCIILIIDLFKEE